jgi:hypothetical protein
LQGHTQKNECDVSQPSAVAQSGTVRYTSQTTFQTAVSEKAALAESSTASQSSSRQTSPFDRASPVDGETRDEGASAWRPKIKGHEAEKNLAPSQAVTQSSTAASGRVKQHQVISAEQLYTGNTVVTDALCNPVSSTAGGSQRSTVGLHPPPGLRYAYDRSGALCLVQMTARPTAPAPRQQVPRIPSSEEQERKIEALEAAVNNLRKAAPSGMSPPPGASMRSRSRSRSGHSFRPRSRTPRRNGRRVRQRRRTRSRSDRSRSSSGESRTSRSSSRRSRSRARRSRSVVSQFSTEEERNWLSTAQVLKDLLGASYPELEASDTGKSAKRRSLVQCASYTEGTPSVSFPISPGMSEELQACREAVQPFKAKEPRLPRAPRLNKYYTPLNSGGIVNPMAKILPDLESCAQGVFKCPPKGLPVNYSANVHNGLVSNVRGMCWITSYQDWALRGARNAVETAIESNEQEALNSRDEVDGLLSQAMALIVVGASMDR